ncbi:MAG: hypothetical protein MI923_26435 [Phycisphaerales bacterium]|nr:hypothetical protein [Phycisphaerales bacterium]
MTLTRSARWGRSRHRRGVALLEVVVSLGILLVAMGVIGMTFRNGQHHVELAERMTRGMLMTERLLVELDTNILDMQEREQSGWFYDVEHEIHETVPGMSWRVEINPSERIQGMLEVDISIYMGDPDDEEQRQNILFTRVFRAEPQGIDFERDFGLDEDQIQQLTDAIPGGEQLFDPNNFDPRSLAQLDLDTLVELLPTLIQAFGANIAQGQLDQIIQAVESGDIGALQNMAGQMGGAGVGIGGSGGRSGGGGSR